MTILQRYIGKSIAVGTLMSTLIIVGILVLMSLLGELKNIGEGDYSIAMALIYVLMRLPNELYQFSPMLVLLGSIIGLSILTANKEIAVMRVSGFSINGIMISVLGSALMIVLVVSLLGEWFGPKLSYNAEIRKENAQNAGQAVITASGVWYHVDNNFIHINRVVGRQQLEGVTRYEFDNDHRLLASYYAKKLTQDDKQWMMRDVVETTFLHDRTKSRTIAELPLNIQLNANLFNIGLVEASEMSLHKLVKFIRYLQENGLQAAEYKFQFWQRVFQPLASLIMVFLALPFMLGALKSTPLSIRLLAGIVAGFVFFIFNALLGEVSIVYQVPPFFAALLPLLLFAAVGLILVRRIV